MIKVKKLICGGFEKIFQEKYIFDLYKVNDVGVKVGNPCKFLLDASDEDGRKVLEKIVSQISGDGASDEDKIISDENIKKIDGRMCYVGFKKGGSVISIDVFPPSVPIGTYRCYVDEIDRENEIISISVLTKKVWFRGGYIIMNFPINSDNIIEREKAMKLLSTIKKLNDLEESSADERIIKKIFLVEIKTSFHRYGGEKNVLGFRHFDPKTAVNIKGWESWEGRMK